jgi:photoactive yellow protein
MFQAPEQSTSHSLNGASVDSLDDSALDEAAFGIICLDAEGTILRYNLYEARLARLDRNYVLGRNFFSEVARCTRTPEFEGKFRSFVTDSSSLTAQSFEYVFDFPFGAQRVAVELHRVPGQDRYYLFVNRKSAGPVRAEATEVAVALSQLVSNESSMGVRRDTLDRRFVEAPATLLLALRATFSLLAPEAWALFAMEWGTQWGRRVAIELEADALESANCALDELPMRAAALRIAHYFESRGWGSAQCEFAAANEGLIELSVGASILAETVVASRDGRRVGSERACALFAGVFAGSFSHLASRKLACREVCCRAMGAGECEFVLVASERAAAVDRALEQGAKSLLAVRAALRRAPRTSS